MKRKKKVPRNPLFGRRNSKSKAKRKSISFFKKPGLAIKNLLKQFNNQPRQNDLF